MNKSKYIYIYMHKVEQNHWLYSSNKFQKAKKSDSSDNCWTAYASAFKDSSKGHLNFRRAGLIYI